MHASVLILLPSKCVDCHHLDMFSPILWGAGAISVDGSTANRSFTLHGSKWWIFKFQRLNRSEYGCTIDEFLRKSQMPP